jgi:hypothetical protein
MSRNLFFSLLVSAMLCGCSSDTVIKSYRTNVKYSENKNESYAIKFERAIFSREVLKNWKINKIGANKYTAGLIHNKIFLELIITLDQRGYTISYGRSANMKAHDNRIHKRYDRFVKNLDKAIRSAISLASQRY